MLTARMLTWTWSGANVGADAAQPYRRGPRASTVIDPLDLLWPPPRRLEPGRADFQPPTNRPLTVSLIGTRDGRARARLLEALPAASAAGEGPIELIVGAPDLGPGAYHLRVGPAGVRILAADDRGLAHGVATLRQLIRAAAGRPWPGCEIEDEPDFPVRGVLLDISRDRVPLTENLYQLVDRLADLKINQLQLYSEHTFAYREHQAVWRNASPMTAEQVRELDAFCHARHIELVPNQQSFGHWQRWLSLPEYAHLAECAGGAGPSSLNPTDPRCLELLAGLYDELLPCFSSRECNVGLDETFDLGLGGSKEAVGQRGKGRVYLEYLNQVHGLLTARGHRMMFWGDVILRHPELVDELPSDALALEWGYEAGHPFGEHGALFAASGLDFHVCPGTSSWQGFVGRTSNGMRNLAQAAAAGVKHGAAGYVITDWGDYGHWQPPEVSLPGLLLGAGHGWRADLELDRACWARLIDFHFDLPAPGLGRTLLELGDAYLAAGSTCENGAPWFYVMRHAREPFPPEPATDLTLGGFEDARDALAGIAVPPGSLATAQGLALWGCRLGAALAKAGPGARPERLPTNERVRLAEDLAELIPEYRAGWLRVSRPGGLNDSVGRFEDLIQLLR
jgi:hexosaminidase